MCGTTSCETKKCQGETLAILAHTNTHTYISHIYTCTHTNVNTHTCTLTLSTHTYKYLCTGGGKDGGKLLPLDGAVGKPLVRLSVSVLVQKPGPSVAGGQEASPPARPALASNVVVEPGDQCGMIYHLPPTGTKPYTHIYVMLKKVKSTSPLVTIG